MPNPINTAPISLFIQQVKAADLSQQREIKMDIKSAKALAYCITEVNARLNENFDVLFQKLLQSTGQLTTIQMDGGGFNN